MVLWVGIGVSGATLLWVSLLNVELRRLRAEQGEPVYRRLPDGRLRFTWNIAQGYQSVRAEAHSRHRMGG